MTISFMEAEASSWTDKVEAHDSAQPKRPTDRDDKISRVSSAAEYVSIVLWRVDPLPSPEKRENPTLASRTLQNL